MECSIFSLYVVGALEQSSFFCMQFNAYSLPPVHSPEPHAALCQSKYANETTIICCFQIFYLEFLK